MNEDRIIKKLRIMCQVIPCEGAILLTNFSGVEDWCEKLEYGSPYMPHSELWLRSITSYGNIVIVKATTLIAKKFEFIDKDISLLCVSVHNENKLLIGAVLFKIKGVEFSISEVQSYIMLSHAAKLAKIINPDLKKYHSMNAEIFNRSSFLESVVKRDRDPVLITEAFCTDELGPKIIYCNSAFLESTGYPIEEIIGYPPIVLQYKEACILTLERLKCALSDYQSITVEMMSCRKNGSRFWAEIGVVPIFDGAGNCTHFIWTQRDINERKRLEEVAKKIRLEKEKRIALRTRLKERETIEKYLKHLAFHDGLTSLYNRAYLMKEISERLADDYVLRKITLLFLDLDGFKMVNDSLGHVAGDTLIQIVAHRLTKCIKSGDVLARIGGDEFAILLTHENSSKEPEQLANRILENLEETIEINGHALFISCSIGIVTRDSSHTSTEDIIRDADVAMYAAKREGRGLWKSFDLSMRLAAVRHLAIESALKKALIEKDFRLNYQPIVNSITGKCSAYEALIRWTHHELGIVGPDVFIPIAEESGLIHPLGKWIMHQACSDFVNNFSLKEKSALRVSVNVSGKEINKSGYTRQLKEILEETGMPAANLQIEITESVLLQNPVLSEQILSEIRELGVKVALDDFGTAYSSLSYIEKYTIDIIKIDKSFISKMMFNTKSRAIVRTIFSLARSLNLQITAEGVENLEQFNILSGFGVFSLQGYLYSRPLNIEKFKIFVDKIGVSKMEN